MQRRAVQWKPLSNWIWTPESKLRPLAKTAENLVPHLIICRCALCTRRNTFTSPANAIQFQILLEKKCQTDLKQHSGHYLQQAATAHLLTWIEKERPQATYTAPAKKKWSRLNTVENKALKFSFVELKYTWKKEQHSRTNLHNAPAHSNGI
jgi:hypothetical protein